MAHKQSSKEASLFDSDTSTEGKQPPCPECGASLTIKHIGNRSFWGCQAYPECTYTRSLHEESEFTPQPLPDSFCPQCDEPLLLKKGRYGFFIGCSAFPSCDYMADPEPEQPQVLAPCPQCKQGELVERTSKYGKQFYACNGYPKCKYAVNYPPVDTPCPVCDWPLMVARVSAQGRYLQCPQKACNHKTKPV